RGGPRARPPPRVRRRAVPAAGARLVTDSRSTPDLSLPGPRPPPALRARRPCPLVGCDRLARAAGPSIRGRTARVGGRGGGGGDRGGRPGRGAAAGGPGRRRARPRLG